MMADLRSAAVLALTVFVVISCPNALLSQTKARYSVVHGWPQVPENTMLDEVSAVAVDSKDNVFIVQRGGRKWPDDDKFDTTPIKVPTVFVFDGKTGALLAKWGEGVLALPHNITVDDKDNVWIADVALHQVFKFSHEGKLLLTVGERAVSASDEKHFDKPSGVAVARDGTFFVSDGYGNNRVMKFSSDGKFVKSWGRLGKGPAELNLPHSIAIDAAGHVCVVDRQNNRIQIFDTNGNLIRSVVGPPFVTPQGIAVGKDGKFFIAQSGDEKPPDETGILVLRQDGTLVEQVGRWGNYDGQFVDPHWVAVDSRGQIYVADFEGKRVQKFVLSGR